MPAAMIQRYKHGGFRLSLFRLHFIRCDRKHPFRWMIAWGAL